MVAAGGRGDKKKIGHDEILVPERQVFFLFSRRLRVPQTFRVPARAHATRILFERSTCGLLNSARFEFISSAAKPLSMRVGLAVLGPGVVITPG